MFELFLEKLHKRAHKNSAFNPYKDIRVLSNLEHYLTQLYQHYFDGVMLVSEAPGYSGCAITGIPFTTVGIMKQEPHEIFKYDYYLAQEYRDVSGQVIWEYLKHKDKLPLLWNAFPFHPYNKYKKLSNRKPNAAEIKQGQWYTQQLIEIFKPKVIASIGRVGQQALMQSLENESIQYIRHPSYGGKADFIQGMDKIYLCTQKN
ncbi:MAG: uracil-DNA glycosylase [Campylobacterota bacterium]|nr:uracil-DNA glycosylase [Campylobacterota bacterium]